MTDFPRKKLTIATRESPLALWQAEHIASRLRELQPQLQVELLGMTTQGDRMLDGPLSKIGGKALFVKELELALLDGRADLAVHSAKDMPAEHPEGLCLHIVGPRGEVRDALVLPSGQEIRDAAGAALQALRPGAIVGTASQRRLCELRRLRPDLQCRSLRGNVNTRLRKLDAGEYDAIILAASGLQRLGFAERISALLDPADMLPAAGQGALGLECREDDANLRALFGQLAERAASLCVAAERGFSGKLEGGCQLPIGALAMLAGDGSLTLRGMVGAAKSERSLSDSLTVKLGRLENTDDPELEIAAAASLGEDLARRLLARGAGALIDAARA